MYHPRQPKFISYCEMIFSLSSLAIQCPSLSDPENGEVEVGSLETGSTANFTCNLGYVINGEGMLTCDTGEWSSEVPTCESMFVTHACTHIHKHSKSKHKRKLQELLQQTLFHVYNVLTCTQPRCDKIKLANRLGLVSGV